VVDKKNLGVLISGYGSNLQVIIDKCREGELNANLAVVVSSRKDAYGLVRAEKNGIPNVFVDFNQFPSSLAFNQHILEVLRKHKVDLVVLAGYMRLVGEVILDAYPQAVINLHPALLPAFPGANGIREAFNYGVKVTGVTVHFANKTYDTGPIILQEIVPVHQDDTLDELIERIHKVEHKLLPRAIKLWLEGRLQVEGRKVKILASKVMS
jgi:phosphoribosylglycinamide formyltransferase-1